MKTPDEIKMGLECCIVGECNSKQRTCPYRKDNDCTIATLEDALAYIQRLERERDAAVEDMTELMKGSEHCMFCKYLSEDGECTRPILEGGAMCWQWRGVQKEVE